jgi:hypothetical protein
MIRCYRSAMSSLPESEIYLLVRTYFGDDAGWNALTAVIAEGSEEGYFATVEYVDDRRFEGFSVEALEAAHPHRADGWDVMYVADERAIKEPAHPLLLVRVGSREELPFRCRADLLYEVDANLSLANLDWDDFRDQVDESGVYGGVAIAGPPTDPATNPLVAAYQSGSDDLITISVPPELWWEMHEDLFEAPMDAEGIGYKEVIAIAKRIYDKIDEGDAVVPRMRPEDDVVVTFQAKDWAFIRERARRRMSRVRIEDDNGRRQRGIVRGQIVELVARHIP